jgi:hypothetical protein
LFVRGFVKTGAPGEMMRQRPAVSPFFPKNKKQKAITGNTRKVS